MSAIGSTSPATPPDIVDAGDYAWLTGYCARLAGAECAADIAQETLIEAWRNQHKLYDAQGRRGWMTVIARHVHRRWLRRQQRDQRLTSLDACDDGDLPQDDDATIERDLEQRELTLLIDRALTWLPGDLRNALIAHYVEGLPQNEIAARLGVTQGTLAVRLHRGKTALRQIFTTHLRDDAAGLWPDRDGSARVAGDAPVVFHVWSAQTARMAGYGQQPPDDALSRLRRHDRSPDSDHRRGANTSGRAQSHFTLGHALLRTRARYAQGDLHALWSRSPPADGLAGDSDVAATTRSSRSPRL